MDFEQIPKLGFGLMRLPMQGNEIDIEQGKRMVDTFIERGFTYFDTAYVYGGGKSEEFVKTAISSRYPRERYLLASKMPIWCVKQKSDLDKIFEEQLRRTGAGYFDFYLLHSLTEDKLARLDKFDAWEYIKRKKKEGFIRHIGFSFHDTADKLEKLLAEHPETEFVQLQINYADWDSSTVQSEACYKTARKYNKPIIIMEPVKGGSLAELPEGARSIFKSFNKDASVASWAVRFAAGLPGVMCVLSGMSDYEQLNDNTSFMQNMKPLSTEEKKIVDDVRSYLSKIPVIPCTACKYCVDGCPKGINIPELFNIMNNYTRYRGYVGTKTSYSWEDAKAGDCISCGKCRSICPQHINIPEELKKISELYDN